MDKYCLLNSLLLAFCFYTMEDQLTMSSNTHCGLDCLTPIIIRENALTDLPTGQTDGDIFLEIPPSQMTLVCAKDKITN